MDLALNNLQMLIYHKTQTNKVQLHDKIILKCSSICLYN